MKVKKGVFKTVSLAYGNGYNEVLEAFFKCGWALKTDIQGKINHYVTFESGVDATMPLMKIPNTYIL